ncbi:MAG: hypothetical protein IJC88_02395 [Oscillospiraceae bacterium]|nr:hypothetical protein [Oscillospiraceae bacterium]
MARHARKQSVFSMLTSILVAVVIVYAVLMSFFGSWEQFVYQLLESLPFSNGLCKAVSRIIQVENQYITTKEVSITATGIFLDLLKLFIATVILGIIKKFYPSGKHVKEKLFSFGFENVVLPVVVSFGSALLVTYLVEEITQLGGFWPFLIGAIGTISTVGAFLWINPITIAFFGISLLKTLPALLSTLFSYCLVVMIIMMVSVPEYKAVFLSLVMIFLVIIVLLGVIDDKLDRMF